MQFQDPDFSGGANALSLREAQENVLRFGVSDPKHLNELRPPMAEGGRE